MTNENCSAFKSFLLIVVVTGICVYTAYRLLQIRHVNLDAEMGQEDQEYFRDGVLINKEAAEEQGVRSQKSKREMKHEVKKRASWWDWDWKATTYDDSYVSDVMTEYNLDFENKVTLPVQSNDQNNQPWEEQDVSNDESNPPWQEQDISNDQSNPPWEEQDVSNDQTNPPWEEQVVSNDESNPPWGGQDISNDNSNQPWDEQEAGNGQNNQPWEVQDVGNDQSNQPWWEQDISNDESNQPWEEQDVGNDESNQPWEEQEANNGQNNQPWDVQDVTNDQSNQPLEGQEIGNSQNNQQWNVQGVDNDQNNQPWEVQDVGNDQSNQPLEGQEIGNDLNDQTQEGEEFGNSLNDQTWEGQEVGNEGQEFDQNDHSLEGDAVFNDENKQSSSSSSESSSSESSEEDESNSNSQTSEEQQAESPKPKVWFIQKIDDRNNQWEGQKENTGTQNNGIPEEQEVNLSESGVDSEQNLEPPEVSSHTPTPAPSSPPSRKPDTFLYTTKDVQKIAQEFFNSVTIQKTSEPGQKTAFSTTPRTSPTPATGGLDSTKSRTTTPRPGRPKYTSYKIPTTSTLPPPCFRQPYKINQDCKLNEEQIAVGGPNVTLEDLAKMLFLKTTLATLTDNCLSGEWCIEEDFQLMNMRDKYLPFCPLRDCLLTITDECLNEERRLVMSTLFMFCEVHQNNFTEECTFAMRKMVHVTMTDIFRSKFRRNENVCRDLHERNECEGSCLRSGQNLHCMSAICDHPADIFQQFDQWSWFFTMDDVEERCQLNSTDCSYFQRELAYEAWWNRVLKVNTLVVALQNMDVQVLVGLLCAMLATMAGVVILVYAILKKTSLSYSRDKVEYTELQDRLLKDEEEEVGEYHDQWDELDPNGYAA